ncbi:MAG: protease complex subunit PrcB family protein [Vicingaceae bacterium]
MKKILLTSTILVLIIFQLSCNCTKNAKPTTSNLSFTELKSGNASDYNNAETIKINTKEEFKPVWEKCYAKYDRKPALPEIDFNTNMLVVIALGERNSGGYSLQVEKVIESKNTITITATETKPGVNCASASVMVYPFQIILLPKNNKKVVVAKNIKINDCGK